MIRVGRFKFAVLIVLIFFGMSALIYWNQQAIEELRQQGKQPVSALPATTTQKGEKGDSPTPAEIAQAVADYCATTGTCAGERPSEAVVFAAVSQYCALNRCKGGDGSDAPEITPAQIQAQVVAYCAINNCRGADGQDAVGTPGVNGTNGLSPVLSCVIRTTNDLPTRYVAWKYETESNEAFRDLYKLPVWAECVNPIDLRTPV